MIIYIHIILFIHHKDSLQEEYDIPAERSIDCYNMKIYAWAIERRVSFR